MRLLEVLVIKKKFKKNADYMDTIDLGDQKVFYPRYFRTRKCPYLFLKSICTLILL